MQNAWIWIVVVVVILVGGFVWWQGTQPAQMNVILTPEPVPTPVPTQPSAATGTSATSTSGTAMTTSVSYSANGYSPAVVTIKKGGTVTWTAQGRDDMWVATAPHPAHTAYDGTSRSAHCDPNYSGGEPFDQCAPGMAFTFTFEKAGTFPYHDHVDATKFGRVIVEE